MSKSFLGLQEEQGRNKLGDMLIFRHQPDSGEDSFCLTTLPSHFGDVTKCNSTCTSQPPLPPLPAGQPGFLPQVGLHTDTAMPVQQV